MRKGLDMPRVVAEFEAKHRRPPNDAELADALKAPVAGLPELKDMARTGYQDCGFRIYDISDLTRPRQIAFQKTGGIGVHRFDSDADYAYISIEMEDFRGNPPSRSRCRRNRIASKRLHADAAGFLKRYLTRPREIGNVIDAKAAILIAGARHVL